MTIEEQARKEVERFITEINETDFHLPSFISSPGNSEKYARDLEEETFNLAKQCALIESKSVRAAYSYALGLCDGSMSCPDSIRDRILDRIDHQSKIEEAIKKL